ncbi:ABC transporter ATP-binding protein [Desulfosarcina ovata]|uniref:ABC transporter ATP-binding protein n=1 Tax=Desulfosarcina ovata subsp. ovata TaxID=2752305 RepID=A0A5K8AKA2_9BACT|nr:ATP-binding cassette domain-containing protein [Desulfosarcina ovata]BBO93153.1 ABC transporter ATP-binding protein [Desulfosarcina ovata subsp. ovata]
MLEIENLMVFFENALALNGLNLTVQQGEVVAVIGSNSAGKTTLLNAVAGLVNDMRINSQRRGGKRISTYGHIYFKGEDIIDWTPRQRVLNGIVLSRERHPIFQESSVLENLKIAGYLRKRSEISNSLAYIFRLFPALKALKRRVAGFLSGGEQQMLAIAMALVARPALLLLDEPLLGLSPHMQATVMQAVVELKQFSGITVLICEQFAQPVLPIIDRGYVLENGMLTFSGTGAELIGNPEIHAAYFGRLAEDGVDGQN